MATSSLIAFFYSSLLLVVSPAFSHVASEEQDVVHGNSLGFDSINRTADFSGKVSPRDDGWCPTVCPGCPACPPCPRHIPPGYQIHEGLGYYKMHYEQMSWHDAKAGCEHEGGYLVVLNSQKEANLTSSFLTKYNIEQLHVGFFDVTKKGKYITVLGDPLASTGYEIWKPGEPNHVGKENCGSFYANKGLNDVTCSAGKPFLCELFA